MQKRAREIAEEVQDWPGLIPFASELKIPVRIDRPIPQLPLYKDGWSCQLDPARCQYICRDKNTLRVHWRTVHEWSVTSSQHGGSGKAKKEMVEKRFNEAAKHVHCQRFFPSRGGSQYFEVQQPEEAREDQAYAVAGEALWDQVRDKAMKCWAEVEKKNQDTIQEAQAKEANPWLQRAGWSKYLKELNRPELLESIREPENDDGGDVAGRVEEEEKEKEPVEAAIWKAMGEVAEISQSSTVNRVGVFVRMEAIRTEQHQTRYQPLQPYQEEEAVKDRVRPWRQVLMFFARTQREHQWRSPTYQFTRAQQRAWDGLVVEARRVVEIEAGRGERSDDDEEEGEDSGMDSETDHDETDHDETDHNETDTKPKPLTRIQKACLDFCMELLNQTVSRREYDSALVCALAVLGVAEGGWKGPDQYPPMLSSMIKIARFMVVQKALEMAGPDDDDEDDRPYDFDSNISPVPAAGRQRKEGCLQIVAKMMDKFMVRGSHGPMQWMLDLRTYGLKIHYNTTAIGHIGWHGHDEILYKNIQFNMSQFRSMVHGLVEQCRKLMMDELLFCGDKYTGEQMPEVPWKSLRDNPTDVRPGWNFLQDQRTRMPVDGQVWLFDRIGRDEDIRRRFLRPGSENGINKEGVREYMRQVVKFQEKLLVLMHITGKFRPIFFPRRNSGGPANI